MNIQAKKLNLIEKLILLSDTTTINKIDKLLNKTTVTKYKTKLKPMTGAEYKLRLDKAEEDFKKGRVISQENLEKEEVVEIFNGVPFIPGDTSIDTTDLNRIFTGRNIDARKLRKELWQRGK